MINETADTPCSDVWAAFLKTESASFLFLLSLRVRSASTVCIPSDTQLGQQKHQKIIGA